MCKVTSASQIKHKSVYRICYKGVSSVAIAQTFKASNRVTFFGANSLEAASLSYDKLDQLLSKGLIKIMNLANFKDRGPLSMLPKG